MNRKMAAACLTGTALASPLGFALQAHAAESTDDTIIVTAQRREQNLLDVPLSIAAVSGDNLEAKGLESITDLRFETPGFISLSGTGYTQIYVRGVGNNIFVGADPSVATFIDEVPRVYGSLTDNFINVERVEVLKGAQGGLYGRNATGGVINIITRQPTDEPTLQGRISYGEYDSLDASAYGNIPIGNSVALNFAVNRRTRDPYLKNIGSDNPYPAGTTSFFGDPNSTAKASPLNNADFYGLDGKLRIRFTDNFKITFSGDYNRKKDADGNGWVQQDTTRNYLVYLGYAMAAGISNPVAPWRKPRKGEGYSGIESFSHTEDYGVSARAELNLESFDLISITALRWNNSNFRGDIGGAPVPMAGFFTDFDRRNFYQELRLVSSGSGRLRYLGGASYYSDKIDSLLRGLFIGFPRPDTLSQTETENFSIYGEISYDLTDALTVTASLRYVDETKDAFFPAQASFAQATVKTKQNKLLPSLTITHKVGDGMIYARYARGFKTGGINPIVHPQPFLGAPGSTFGPEVVDSFEGGYRANLAGGRVQLTAAIFYNDFKGVQIARAGNAANPTISNAILNAGTARTYGAEASVTWRITDAITISGNIGYLNARYKNASYPGSPIVDPFDASGNIMSLSPKWQGGASLAVDQPISDTLRFKGNILYSHVSRYNYQYEEHPLLWQPGYDVVNVRAGFARDNDDLGLYVFANNLFDKQYTIFGTRNSLGTLLTPAAPRVIGVTFEFKLR